jgi:hypothetical protein
VGITAVGVIVAVVVGVIVDAVNSDVCWLVVAGPHAASNVLTSSDIMANHSERRDMGNGAREGDMLRIKPASFRGKTASHASPALPALV